MEPESGTETADGSLRSLEDAGLTETEVFTDMQGYYTDCYDQILQNGKGRYSFYNVIEGDELITEWYQNYQNDYYRQAYMENVMMEMGASSCEITLEVEELQGARYLIRHDLYIL